MLWIMDGGTMRNVTIVLLDSTLVTLKPRPKSLFTSSVRRKKLCAVNINVDHNSPPIHLLSQKENERTKARKNIKKCLWNVTTDENNHSYISIPRQYPLAVCSCFYNLWRDNYEALHLYYMEFIIQIVLTNTICFSSPSSFSSRLQLMHLFSRLPLVLQRHSQGKQLLLQPSKSNPECLLLPSTSFCYGLLLQLQCNNDSL